MWQIASAMDNPNEVGLWVIAVSTATWAFRTWWKTRLEEKHKRNLEQQIENGWTHGDESLTGSKNPGRTTVQLVELIHHDLQAHKTETNTRFDDIHKKLGRIEGTLEAYRGGK